MNKKKINGPGRKPSETQFVLPKNALLRVNLGQAFAEYDKVLKKPGVFVETPALIAASDISRSKCFFVGRRGTGKTAITFYLGSKKQNVINIHPQLFASLGDLLNPDELRDTRQKPFHSLVACFRRAILDEVIGAWVHRRLTEYDRFPSRLRAERNFIEDFDFDTRMLTLVEQVFDCLANKDERGWSKQLSRAKEVGKLMDEMREGPAWDFIVAIDRIDDTWNGSDTAVVLLMALMHACVELAAASETVHPLLFLRENLFQRVRQIDNEFTRIETADVSLDWTEELLVEMIERRLRLGITTVPPIGKTWDCFFDPVDGQSSKEFVLGYCQQRPRDVLIYCSFAVEEAQHHRHAKVTADDLLAARRRYSLNRLKDVGDEYSENFPQIQLILSRFYGLGREYTVHAITQFIQKLMVDVEIQRHCRGWIKDYYPPHRFIGLLYGIGFCGVKKGSSVEYRSPGIKSSDAPAIDQNTHAVIHPCYADALGLQDIVVQSLDNVSLRQEGLVLELPAPFTQLDEYTARLDVLLGQLDNLEHGASSAREYEEFVGEVVRLCFFRSLTNVQDKPRDVSNCVVRDWIASNVAETGFWKNVHQDYGANQVVFECKNYAELGADDFHQASYYMGSAMGYFCIVCFRGDPKHSHYYEHIKRIHDKTTQGKGLVVLVGDSDLKVFLRQERNGKLKESHLQDRLDYTVRQIS